MTVSPTLTAMMCDGLGWFEEADYKRMLLVYDRILYLLPSDTVQFTDGTGVPHTMVFPGLLKAGKEFEPHHVDLSPNQREMIESASMADARSAEFAQAVSTIPPFERLYTWRLVNSDAGFGAGQSRALRPTEEHLAHALLLNKFFLSADEAGAVPITGKDYIHQLIGAKYRLAIRAIREHLPQALPVGLTEADIRSCAVLQGLVSAFVPDEALRVATYADIITFKAEQRRLFEQFSFLVRSLTERIESLPSEPAFPRELRNLVATDVWKEKSEIEEALRVAWFSAFTTSSKAALKSDTAKASFRLGLSAMALGVAPALALTTMTWAAVLTSTVGAASWLMSEAVELVTQRSNAKKNGLYYLMRFVET